MVAPRDCGGGIEHRAEKQVNVGEASGEAEGGGEHGGLKGEVPRRIMNPSDVISRSCLAYMFRHLHSTLPDVSSEGSPQA